MTIVPRIENSSYRHQQKGKRKKKERQEERQKEKIKLTKFRIAAYT